MPPFRTLPPLHRHLLTALALLGAARSRSWLHGCLSEAGMQDEATHRPFTHEALNQAMRALAADGWLVESGVRLGHWRVSPDQLPTLYGELLDTLPAPLRRQWAQALLRADAPYAGPSTGHERLPSTEAAVTQLRLQAYTGLDAEGLLGSRHRMPWGAEFDDVLRTAVLDVVDTGLLSRLHPSVQRFVLFEGLRGLQTTWHATLALDVPAATAAHLAGQTGPGSFALRCSYAEHLLLQDRPDEVPPVLAPLAEAEAPWPLQRDILLTALPMRQARWAAAEAAFDTVHAALRKATGKRRGLVPLAVATGYVQSLLAQGSPAHLQKALKFCLGEGGKREPVLDNPFGLMALAIQMRTGEAPREPARFKPYSRGGHVSPLDWWRWLMRAWLKEGPGPEPFPADQADAAQRLQERLAQAGLAHLRAQLDAAMQVLGGERPPEDFFIAAPLEGWQFKLDALRALAEPASPATAAKGAVASRLVWALEVDRAGGVLALEPFEQTQGPRGWGKPKPVSLKKLQRMAEALPPHDAAVARTIRQTGYPVTLRFDLASALGALVGHPALAFLEDPTTLVRLDEAGPELDVVSDGEQLRVRMVPPLRPTRSTERWATSALEERELEALRACTVLRDGPQRARLVRLTPAQQRVAQLLGPDGLTLPRRGAAELQEVLQGLGTHFRIQADEAAAAEPAQEVAADARLRAELTPVGQGLRLRLVVTPFGEAYREEGPRLVPASGRARLIAHLRGQTLGVQRDLARERQHLDTVLEACPMLPEPDPNAPAEWLVDEPEQALLLVERLRPLNAVAALDWPQGRPVRVDTAGLDALALRVHTRQEWLALAGGLEIDEQLVLSLKQLIAFAGGSKSRFVPMGEGRYLALTQELRTRLDDLAAVAEARRGDEVQLPVLAAGWVEEALQGAKLETDAAYTERLYRLARARDLQPALPATLQASLRPYQEEGYVWAMRLAEAGLGACLADDMGLGKTLQALAVLLARAAGGPALVVAPTSLTGNWQAEARRFAPVLRVHVYAEGDREAVLANATHHDLVLVSYQLLQQDAAAFAARPWHTLVIDEAQAIKNAAAKRSQAVFDLQADFRLALSGTPIENRLAELWSIMRAVNPGLLGTLAHFNERFAGLIERQKDRQAQRILRRLVAPFVLRRTKAQVLDDLPPRTELILTIEPEAHERAHYEALRRDALEAAEKSLSGNAAGQAHLNVLAQLTRLRRAACDPRLVSPGLQWVGAKVQAFGELAAELVANGHKALVFSQFVDFLGLLREPLDAAGIAYQYLDGSTPAPERTRRVQAFQEGTGDLFLISLKAGGFGLNLTVADYVVIADPWWNPAAEDQATGRAHRIGQQRPVTVYRLVNRGTLEEGILTLHKDKRELADRVLEGDGDDGAALGAVPAPEELIRLMRGTPDPA
jgi:superfamily II DNA or RNA helicase